MSSGRIIWITGLPGAGKTTIAKLVVERLEGRVVHIDGDEVREVLDLKSYSIESRKEVARTISGICLLLARKGFQVVCSTVSLWHSIHELNRSYELPYFEVFLDVSKEVLSERDQKSLYSAAVKDESVALPGVNQPAEFPRNPDLILKNDGRETADRQATRICRAIEAKYKGSIRGAA